MKTIFENSFYAEADVVMNLQTPLNVCPYHSINVIRERINLSSSTVTGICEFLQFSNRHL